MQRLRAKMEDDVAGRTTDRHYWFGRTETGYLAGVKLTGKYAGGNECDLGDVVSQHH